MKLHRCENCGTRPKLIEDGHLVNDSAYMEEASVYCPLCGNAETCDSQESYWYYEYENPSSVVISLWNQNNNPTLIVLISAMLRWVKQKIGR